MERFEQLGYQVMHRSGGGAMATTPSPPRSATPTSGGSSPGLLGQAFVVAWNTIRSTATAPSTSPSG